MATEDLPIYPAQGFVFHHSGGSTLSGLVSTLQQRGLGSEYLMDRDGTIYPYGGAGSPHMQPNDAWGGMAPGLTNANAVGMELVARNNADVTPAQIASARNFISANYPNVPVYGHGEVNPGHKQPDEGMAVVSAIRADRGNPGGTMASDWTFTPGEGTAAAPAAPAAAPAAAAPGGGMPVLEAPPSNAPIDWARIEAGPTAAPSGPPTFMEALRTRAGVPAPEAPEATDRFGLPLDTTRMIGSLPDTNRALGLPGYAAGAALDAAGHPNWGTAAQYGTNTVLPALVGAKGVYNVLTRAPSEATFNWENATNAVEDWRAARATQQAQMQAAREAQQANSARNAAYADYYRQTGRFQRPMGPDVPVPAVTPLTAQTPPFEMRLLASAPPPPGHPSFAEWLAQTAIPRTLGGVGTAARVAHPYARELGKLWLAVRLLQGLENLKPPPGSPQTPGAE